MGKGKDNRIALGLATLSLAFSLHTLAQSDNLELGAPGTADKVIDREGYALGYRTAWKTARWVTYRLTDDEVLNQVARRSEEFAPDPQIVGGPQLEDYRGSGYDRGHLAPAADMKWSQKAMTETGTQRDKLIEELKRTDALLEYAVQHGEEEEAERLREKMRRLTEAI